MQLKNVGKSIVLVDLSTGKIEWLPVPNSFTKRYFGGRGFNTRLLYEFRNRIPEDWRDPDNVLCVSSGLFSGTSWPSSGRTTVSVLRSPVTDGFSDGNLGGYFGANLRLCGIGAIVIRGESLHPVMLRSERSGTMELVPLTQDVYLLNNFDFRAFVGLDEYVTLSIGLAGVSEVFCATVSSDEARTAGGGGTGAVFGAKNLKAISVKRRPDWQLNPASMRMAFTSDESWDSNSSKFIELSESVTEKIKAHPVFDTFSKYGTLSLTDIHAGMEYLPHRNFTNFSDPNWKNVKATTMKEEVIRFRSCGTEKEHDATVESLAEKGKFGCPNCPVLCGNLAKIEYESVVNLGPKLGIYDPRWICEMSDKINDYGLDVIQSTSIISALMQMYSEKKIDLPIKWGNKAQVKGFIESMVEREVVWSVAGYFAEGYEWGMREALGQKQFKFFGDSYSDYFVAVKNYAMSAVVPSREQKGVVLAIATASRGADHLRSMPTLATYARWYFGAGWLRNLKKLIGMAFTSFHIIKKDARFLVGDLYEKFNNIFGVPVEITNEWRRYGFLFDKKKIEGWGHMVKFCQEMYAVADSVSICRFTSTWRFGVGPELIAEGIGLLFGLPNRIEDLITWKEILEVGERVSALERKLNSYYGSISMDDSLPRRFFRSHWDEKGIEEPVFTRLIEDYYYQCRYNSCGFPTERLLAHLGVPDSFDFLARMNNFYGLYKV